MPNNICKVLVVEDNDELRLLLGDVFEHEGYRFVIARDPAGMRQILAGDPEIDVVVLDVLLPGRDDGLVLAKEVADRGHGVVLVTGDHRQAERLDKSGHRYLLKPFRIGSLLGLVGEVLTETKRRCERPRTEV